MKTAILMFLAVAVTTPAFAEGKPLTVTQFAALAENRGLGARQIDRRYTEYRDGRYAVTTLDSSNAR